MATDLIQAGVTSDAVEQDLLDLRPGHSQGKLPQVLNYLWRKVTTFGVWRVDDAAALTALTKADLAATLAKTGASEIRITVTDGDGSNNPRVFRWVPGSSATAGVNVLATDEGGTGRWIAVASSDLKGANITLADAGGYYSTDTVEAALQQIMAGTVGLTITPGTEAAEAIPVTVQLTDIAGNEKAAQKNIFVQLLDKNGDLADPTAFRISAIGTGTRVAPASALGSGVAPTAIITTDETGEAVFSVLDVAGGTADELTVMVTVLNEVFAVSKSAQITFTA